MGAIKAGWRNLREVIFIILCSRGFIQNRKLNERKVKKAGIDCRKLFEFLQGIEEDFGSLHKDIMDKTDLRPFEVKIIGRYSGKNGEKHEITEDQFQRIMDWKDSKGIDVESSSGILSKLVGACKCFAEILLVCMLFRGISKEELAKKARINPKTLEKYLQGEDAPAEIVARRLVDVVCPKEAVTKFLNLAFNDNHKIKTRRIESTDPRSSNQLWTDAGLPIPEAEGSQEPNEGDPPATANEDSPISEKTGVDEAVGVQTVEGETSSDDQKINGPSLPINEDLPGPEGASSGNGNADETAGPPTLGEEVETVKAELLPFVSETQKISFGELFREYRGSMTQTALSREMGVSHAQISSIEGDKQKEKKTRLRSAEKLIAVFGMSADDQRILLQAAERGFFFRLRERSDWTFRFPV